MRALLVLLTITTMASFSLVIGAAPAMAAEVGPLVLSALSTPRDENAAMSKINEAPRYAAACGLCTDEDCCGGTATGWKLCTSDCPSGQYKCMQVAACP
jgi:hypothetical protein